MHDASMDATLNALVAAGFGAAGQKCTAISVIVFVGGINPWCSSFFPLHILHFFCAQNTHKKLSCSTQPLLLVWIVSIPHSLRFKVMFHLIVTGCNGKGRFWRRKKVTRKGIFTYLLGGWIGINLIHFLVLTYFRYKHCCSLCTNMSSNN